MNKLIACIAAILFFSSSYAQDNTETYKPTGKPFIKVFTNFHSTFTDGANHNAFDFTRGYLGYGFNLSEKFSGKLTLDIGDPGVGKLQLTAYLKNAYFQYKSGRFTTRFGMIGSNQFNLQEKQWGNRYLFKSFQDAYNFGPSADLGIFASYQFHEVVGADVMIANGEGYKTLEIDSVLKYAVGVTITPVKGLNLRGYFDIMGQDSAQQTLSFFAGYSRGNFDVGAEYNLQNNHSRINKQNFKGMSFYGSYQFKVVKVFARYDQLSSDKIGSATDPWNYKKDGQEIIAGLEFVPVKHIKISPNYQGWIPANGAPVIHGAFVSCEISF